jgi:hypothetical protein
MQRTRHGILALLALALTTSLLAGCNIVNACGNSCPAGYYHDSFCGCGKQLGPVSSGTPAPNDRNKFYVSAEYSCVDVSHPDVTAGSCQLQQWGPSCREARDALVSTAQQLGDPCVHCTNNATDNTRRWDGKAAQWKQAGACSGWSSLQRPPLEEMASRIDLAEASSGFLDGGSLRIDNAPILLTVSLRTTSTAPQSPKKSTTDPLACEKECRNHGPFCLRASLESSQDRTAQVMVLRNMLEDGHRTEISNLELTKTFGITPTNDKCDRGITKITGENISNSGMACDINTALVKDKDLTFQIKIPKQLEGKRSINSGTMVLTFDEPSSAPTLRMADPDFNRDFGGRVERISADMSTGVVSTESGCISVTLTPH